MNKIHKTIKIPVILFSMFLFFLIGVSYAEGMSGMYAVHLMEAEVVDSQKPPENEFEAGLNLPEVEADVVEHAEDAIDSGDCGPEISTSNEEQSILDVNIDLEGMNEAVGASVNLIAAGFESLDKAVDSSASDISHAVFELDRAGSAAVKDINNAKSLFDSFGVNDAANSAANDVKRFVHSSGENLVWLLGGGYDFEPLKNRIASYKETWFDKKDTEGKQSWVEHTKQMLMQDCEEDVCSDKSETLVQYDFEPLRNWIASHTETWFVGEAPVEAQQPKYINQTLTGDNSSDPFKPK